MNNPVTGFSKPSKEEINWIAKEYFSTPGLSFYYKTIGTQMKRNYKATR
jgi:hypothetical protein